MRPLEALRAILRDAAADSFANVTAADLGADLRRSVESCRRPEFSKLRAELEGFDGLGRQDRSVIVARAMRLVASLPAAPKRPPKPETITPQSVHTLPGVGPATGRKLEAKGLGTIVDLALHLPSGYQDRRTPRPLDEVDDGDVVVVPATVGSLRQGFARGRFMATMQLNADSGHRVVARWFHRMGGLNRWTSGGRVLAVGPIKRYKGQLSMAHPELYTPDAPGPKIAVRYPAVEGVPARTLAKLVATALAKLDDASVGFEDALPHTVARAQGLPGQIEALRYLHCPPQDLDPEATAALLRGASVAHRRLAFDEFFFFQLALLSDRERAQEQPARVTVAAQAVSRAELQACLPFELTAAQGRALRELETDLGSGRPMLRLLQGDVGSGKTAVAFGAALGVVRSGGQVAIMAPTEILAEQHHRTLAPWCEKAGVRVAILTGATPRAQRTSLLALLGAGQVDVLVGTHALLVSDVDFRELGLVVVDEQHRFGVEQRAVLRQKGGMPHLLVMTATPIPRTMALCAYGELEVSIIDALPPGRAPASTRLFTGRPGLPKARAALCRRVEGGEQAFVVCPLVEASDVLDVTDVEQTAAALRELLPRHRIEIVHGRMTSRDKDARMAQFREGNVDVLVATTVIEVGVDVPAAKVILVEHAERFGLAQLHQLRGRVGRGGGTSQCLVHTSYGPSSDSGQRLAVLTETTDGFVVAERDLAFRGPGEVFGTRQAGAPRLRFAGFGGEGTGLLVAAREAARDLLERDPGLEKHPGVQAELARRRAAGPVIAGEAG